MPLLAFVSFYTGLLLSGAMFVPLWSMEFLPYLFLNSGVLTGLAGSGLVYILYQAFFNQNLSKSEDTSKIMSVLGYLILVFIFIELVEIQMFMDYLASNPIKDDNSGLLLLRTVVNLSMHMLHRELFHLGSGGELSDWD